MQLERLAHTILFGDRLEDKLHFETEPEDEAIRPALAVPPRFPGRPRGLSRIGKAKFPPVARLHEPRARAELLHFFANHELLALELMALVLLRFPDAPREFRLGVLSTIGEEQEHLRLYLGRMRELGMDLGELPVSDYFWNAMREMSSPLQFVVQMSLTFEQANLDYSRFYQRAVAEVGDVATAAILERVYREEIGHVKHGLTWFNRWRPGSESEWDAYLRLLPPPMTPRRAKGRVFCAEARRRAGLSDTYVERLEQYSGSKGRPPALWLYHPMCEAEIARGRRGGTPTATARRLQLDLETLPMHLALETDVVLVHEAPRPEWLRELRALGFPTPQFRELRREARAEARATPESTLTGLEPWGWSPGPFERFRPLRDRLVDAAGGNGAWCARFLAHEGFSQTGIGELFSKAWSTRFLAAWLEAHPDDREAFGTPENCGEICAGWPQAQERIRRAFHEKTPLVAKAPWGTSGTQNRRILDESELDSQLGGWIRNVIETQGAIVLEPWLDRLLDLSIQMEVRRSGVRLLGIRRFHNGGRLEYRGTDLDAKLGTSGPEILRFLHSEQEPLERWRALASSVGEALLRKGYEGPAGVDALVWREAPSGKLRLKPLVECNPRWTMGRVALALESRLAQGVTGRFAWLAVRELAARGLSASPDRAARELGERHPPRVERVGSALRLVEGVVATTDPQPAREVLTFLVAGPRALQDPALSPTI